MVPVMPVSTPSVAVSIGMVNRRAIRGAISVWIVDGAVAIRRDVCGSRSVSRRPVIRMSAVEA